MEEKNSGLSLSTLRVDKKTLTDSSRKAFVIMRDNTTMFEGVWTETGRDVWNAAWFEAPIEHDGARDDLIAN